MELELYNTLTRRKEIFKPLHADHIDFYSCGPTVYNRVHVGNLRAFLFADTLSRWLSHGHKSTVRWVMNITDIDDKTIRGARETYPDLDPLRALQKFTRTYEELFFTDLEKIALPRSSFFKTPRATESISAMQSLIRQIYENGYAYEKDGSVYFSLEKYLKKEQYGKLVSLDLTALKTGTRTLADEVEKENLQDFVLWKGQKPGEPFWEFTFFGEELPGRPGWHIECSAMEYEAFGTLPFDIHSGGVDLTFPHHEDEIAQSIAGYGIAPATFWVHNEHLMVEGQKMSKSLGNFYTLDDLLKKGHSPDAIRFFLVSNHYRTKLNLTEVALEAASHALQRIRNALESKSRQAEHIPSGLGKDYRKAFFTSMNDDLNMPQAVAVLFEMIADERVPYAEQAELFRLAELTLGVRFFPEESIIPEKILSLAKKRQTAKLEKNYLEADRLRSEILTQGYELRDDADGYHILPKTL